MAVGSFLLPVSHVSRQCNVTSLHDVRCCAEIMHTKCVQCQSLKRKFWGPEAHVVCATEARSWVDLSNVSIRIHGYLQILTEETVTTRMRGNDHHDGLRSVVEPRSNLFRL